MSIFFPPTPPVFLGGAQPYDGPQKRVPSSVVVNNPPFSHAGRIAATMALVLAWQPPPPSPMEGGWQPLQPAQRVGSALNVPVNNPPIANLATTPAFNPILTSWQPPPPNAFLGGWQPLQPPQLAPIDEGIAVNNPPFVHPGKWASTTAAVLAWQPPPPNAFIGGQQPLAPLLHAFPTPPAVNNPPFGGADYLQPQFYTVLDTWKFVPPTLTLRAPPFVPGMSVDKPPTFKYVPAATRSLSLIQRSPALIQQGVPPTPPVAIGPPPPAWLPIVLQAWQPPLSWPLPNQTPPFVPGMSVDNPQFIQWVVEERRFQQQQPTAPRFIQNSLVTVNPPPLGIPNLETMSLIETAWQPPPPWPYFGAYQPLTPKLIIPIGSVVNNPPTTSIVRLSTILAAWQPVPPTLVLRPGPFTPSSVTNNPPTTSIVRLSTILAAWQPVPPTLILQAPPFTPGVTVNPPPTVGRSVLNAILAAWQPGPPTLILQPGPFTPGLAVNNPPPYSLVTFNEIVGLWQPVPPTLILTSTPVPVSGPAPTPPIFPSLVGSVLPIDESRFDSQTAFVQVDLGYGIFYVGVPWALIIRPAGITPSPEMLLGFNADGTFTLYQPLPVQRNKSGDLTYQPLYGNDVLNQLPVAPTGTTQLLNTGPTG